MQLLENVYRHYPATRAGGGLVPWANESADLWAIRVALPELFTRVISATGRRADDFKIYGGVGEPNRSFAKVPWVAVCNRKVSNSTTRGYYIVLLFHQEMLGCHLSLNQGFTQFQKAYPTNELALYQIEASARRCLDFLNAKSPFIDGKIDLGADLPLGEGYERGSILSRWYPRGISVDETDLDNDLTYLLGQYDRLISFLGPNLTLGLPPASETAFQEAAAKLAKSGDDWQGHAPGPVPIPPRSSGGNMSRYQRDPRVCARALKLSKFRCEANPTHLTFVSRKSGENFVESHHLIPMSLQRQFDVSLDVVENVASLCPNCHRLLHHGRRPMKRDVLRKLFEAREAGLKGRAISMDFDLLLEAYSRPLEDED